MKKLDIEGLLLPENFEDFEGRELEVKYQIGYCKVNKYMDFSTVTIPKPVKVYTKEEIIALEDKMKKEGKL